MLAMGPGEGTRLDNAVKIFNEHQNQAYQWEKSVFLMFLKILVNLAGSGSLRS
jgi:hypothetical protein